MSDLIERQAAIEAIKTWGLIDGLAEGQAIEILADEEKVPSAQVDSKELSFTHNALDTISRQDAIDAVDESLTRVFVEHRDIAEKMINKIPSAQPERETAKFIRWMECKKTATYISYTPHCKCSRCGTEFLIRTIKYCYICGAKMEEIEDDID